MTIRAAIILAGIAAYTASPSVGVGRPESPFGPPVIVDLPKEMKLRSVAVSANRRTAYAHVTIPQMSLWAPIVGFWPQWTALLLYSVIVVILIRLRRKLIRPVDDGDEYCGRCGYALRGLSEDRCPECGVVPTAAYRVRTPRLLPLRHLLWVVGLPMIHFAAATELPPCEGPLCGPYSECVDRSMRSLGWMPPQRPGNVGLALGVREIEAVVELDLVPDAVPRILWRGGAPEGGASAVSADGAFCFIGRSEGLVQIRTSDGSVVRTFPAPHADHSSSWVELSGDGKRLFAGILPRTHEDIGPDKWRVWGTSSGQLLQFNGPAELRPTLTWTSEDWSSFGLARFGVGKSWRGAAISPDGRWWFYPNHTKWGTVFSIATRDMRLRRRCPDVDLPDALTVVSMELTCDGRHLVGKCRCQTWNRYVEPWDRIIVYDISALSATTAAGIPIPLPGSSPVR